MQISYSWQERFDPKVAKRMTPEEKGEHGRLVHFTTMSCNEGLEKEQLKTALLEGVWSPCLYQTGRRKKEYYISSELIVIEFDSHDFVQPKDIIKEVTKKLDERQLWYIIGHSYSHEKERPAFRVVLRMEANMLTCGAYEYNAQKYAKELFGSGYDEATLDPRIWFPFKSAIASKYEGTLPILTMTDEERIEMDTRLEESSQSDESAEVMLSVIKNANPDKIAELWAPRATPSTRKLWLAFLSGCKSCNIKEEDLKDLVDISGRRQDMFERDWNSLSPKVDVGILHHCAKKLDYTSYTNAMNVFKAKEIDVLIKDKFQEYSEKHFKRFSSNLLDQWEDTKWLVKDLIPVNELGWTIAMGGTLKSFLLLKIQMQLAISNEFDMFIGPCQIVRPEGERHVVYITLEDSDAQLKQRVISLLYTISEECGLPVSKLEQLIQKYFHYSTTGGGPFITLDGNTPRLSEAGIFAAKWIDSVNPCMIVLDTLTTHTAVDENKAELRGAAMVLYKSTFMSKGATFMIVHHTGKSGDLDGRGSSAQVNAVRFELFLERKKELEKPGMGKIIELTTGKNNIGLADFKDFYFRLSLKETSLTINGKQQKRNIPRITYERNWEKGEVSNDSLYQLECLIEKSGTVTATQLKQMMCDSGYEKSNARHASRRKELLESDVLMIQKEVGKVTYYSLTDNVKEELKEIERLAIEKIAANVLVDTLE